MQFSFESRVASSSSSTRRLLSSLAYEDYTSPTMSKAYLRAICLMVDAAKFTETFVDRVDVKCDVNVRRITLNKTKLYIIKKLF